MPERTIAIGDIHGCSLALDAILDAIRPRPDDVIVTLGDYINRGPDSRGVIDRLIKLSMQCRLIPLLGNHDQMLLEARSGLHTTTWLGMVGFSDLVQVARTLVGIHHSSGMLDNDMEPEIFLSIRIEEDVRHRRLLLRFPTREERLPDSADGLDVLGVGA